jgi:hypothetical protein
MSSSDSKQPDCRSFRPPSTLLPVSQGVDADTHRLRELRLCQANEAPKGSDILSGFNLPLHQALADSRRDSSGELFLGQFRNLGRGAGPPM